MNVLRPLRDLLQPAGAGFHSFKMGALEEEEGLGVIPRPQGTDGAHHDGVVAAVVLGMQFAIHPGERLAQYGVAQGRRRVTRSCPEAWRNEAAS